MTSARPAVGWYVHHHGAGHLTRFRAVRPHLDARVIVFSSLDRPEQLPADTQWVQLDRDDDVEVDVGGALVDPRDASPTAQGALHWAPIGHSGHASRMSTIASFVATSRFRAFVVDVSVEVTLAVRLLGVRTIVVTQPGDRSDDPHALAYRLADAILAPWPDTVPLSMTLGTVAQKVRRTGAISRFDGRARDGAPIADRILILGSGEALRNGAFDVHRLGPPWIDDPWPEICSAEIVVTAAGQNAIADIAAARARAIVVPQDRPFGEQVDTATRLESMGLAVVSASWPTATEWPHLVARARALTPRWSEWQTSGAARRAAAEISSVAGISAAPTTAVMDEDGAAA